MVDGEGQVADHFVGMVAAVRRDGRPHREAVQAEVEVWADGAADVQGIGQVLVAVVAVVQPPPGPGGGEGLAVGGVGSGRGPPRVL